MKSEVLRCWDARLSGWHGPGWVKSQISHPDSQSDMHCILQVHSLGKLLHVLLTQLASMCLAPTTTTTTTTTGTTTFGRVLLWHVFAFLAGIGGVG